MMLCAPAVDDEVQPGPTHEAHARVLRAGHLDVGVGDKPGIRFGWVRLGPATNSGLGLYITPYGVGTSSG
jgi:hypothetical protein